MNVGIHCRLSRPGRVAALAEFIDFAKSYKKDVWICTREQIADFWHEHHFPRGAGSPVKSAASSIGSDGEGSGEESRIGEIRMVTDEKNGDSAAGDTI